MNIGDYTALARRADELRQKADKASGVLERIRTELRNEFGCKTIAAAEKLADEFRKEKKVAEQRLEKLVAEFRKKWGDRL